jgi:hypothetical protein
MKPYIYRFSNGFIEKAGGFFDAMIAKIEPAKTTKTNPNNRTDAENGSP